MDLSGIVFQFYTGESSNDPETLGKVEASYKYAGAATGFPTMKATFDLSSPSALLLDVDKGCEFRWFQVITSLDPMPEGAVGIPATWKGKEMDSYGTPFVDPPAGGYDYQPDGDDFQPFYWNTETEWPYMHEEGKSTTIVDTPTRPWAGEKVFVTCLVLYCPEEDPNTFYLTENGCFTWSLETRDHGNYIGIVISEPKPVPNSDSPGYVAYLEGALDRSGFPGWSIEPAYSINGNPTSLVFASVD
jgi:hypothetical protein